LAAAQLRTGGIGSYLRNLSTALAARGHAVSILLTESRGDWFDPARERGLDVRLVEGIERRSGVAHAREVAREIRALEPDVLILNHARHAQLSLALLSPRTLALPFVHGDNEWVYRLALSNRAQCAAVIAPSPVVAAGVARRGPGQRVEVIEHGVPRPPTPPDPDPRVSAARFDLVFVGRLDYGKGIELLPAVARQLEARGVNTRLRIIGDGPLRPLVTGSRFACLEWMGARGPEEVTRLISAAHLLLLPSASEGLPLVLLEAQAAGCVPLATRLAGSTDHAVRDGETGFLLDSREPGPYVDRITALASDREHWSALSRAGIDQARLRFSLEAMAERTEALVRALRAESAPPPARGRLDLRLFAPRDLLPPTLRRVFARIRDRRPTPAEERRSG